jgi:hypothetical protein
LKCEIEKFDFLNKREKEQKAAKGKSVTLRRTREELCCVDIPT